eukprot:14701915-Alexandrium_andersonii.AAC.1
MSVSVVWVYVHAHVYVCIGVFHEYVDGHGCFPPGSLNMAPTPVIDLEPDGPTRWPRGSLKRVPASVVDLGTSSESEDRVAHTAF